MLRWCFAGECDVSITYRMRKEHNFTTGRRCLSYACKLESPCDDYEGNRHMHRVKLDISKKKERKGACLAIGTLDVRHTGLARIDEYQQLPCLVSNNL